MKNTAEQIITDFFGDNIESFALNILTVLSFLLKQKSHERAFENILKITSPDVSFDEFMQAISTQNEIYEKQDCRMNILLARKIEVSGEVIESLKNSPSKWLFLALFWAYNFRD
ncbi:MAG: hypothetical protein L0Y61_05460, partial [Epsilonproteobacteria bacterium]|nr:hypothetical protein [Campylobacterota bacterium]